MKLIEKVMDVTADYCENKISEKSALKKIRKLLS